jgi:NlpC/P60 family putative phage cell wall peptidase
MTRADVAAEARSWLGTPYHHQASLKGVGSDCIGVVRGVWRTLYGTEAQAMPSYSPDWAIGAELLLEGARRHLVEVDPAQLDAGDVLVFRMRRGRPAKHCGIVVVEGGQQRFVHAWDAVPIVCETVLDDWWRCRIAAAFRFPGVG